MHPADIAAWEAMDQGSAKPSWQAFIGAPEAADYLTAQGRTFSEQMAEDFECFFGPSWLPRAFSDPSMRTIRKLSPPLQEGWIEGSKHAYIDLLRWWAFISLARQRSISGLDTVRADVSKNVFLARLLHSMTLLRLTALGLSVGASAAVELGAQQGDLELTWATAPPGHSVEDPHATSAPLGLRFEVLTMTAGGRVETAMTQTFEATELLQHLAHTHHVHFDGQMPPLETLRTVTWRKEVERNAETAARLNISLSMEDAGTKLTISPGEEPRGTKLTGPPMQANQGDRIKDQLRRKEDQSAKAGPIWMWLENHGVLDMTSGFWGEPLPEQTRNFATLVHEALRSPTTEGVVLSTSGIRRWPLGSAEEYIDAGRKHSSPYAYATPLVARGRRETLVVPATRPDSHAAKPQGETSSRRCCAPSPNSFNGACVNLESDPSTRSFVQTSRTKSGLDAEQPRTGGFTCDIDGHPRSSSSSMSSASA